MKLLKKPETWENLPSRVLNNFLWDLDLEYCKYESSKAEVIHDIENGNYYGNEKIINSAWAMVSDETYSKWIGDYITLLKAEIAAVENLN
jgi:hypothetical protein